MTIEFKLIQEIKMIMQGNLLSLENYFQVNH
jgi:hypothetical protein